MDIYCFCALRGKPYKDSHTMSSSNEPNLKADCDVRYSSYKLLHHCNDEKCHNVQLTLILWQLLNIQGAKISLWFFNNNSKRTKKRCHPLRWKLRHIWGMPFYAKTTVKKPTKTVKDQTNYFNKQIMNQTSVSVPHVGCAGGYIEIWSRRGDIIGGGGGGRGGRRWRGGARGWGDWLHRAVRYQTAGALWDRGRQRGWYIIHHKQLSKISVWGCTKNNVQLVFHVTLWLF